MCDHTGSLGAQCQDSPPRDSQKWRPRAAGEASVEPIFGQPAATLLMGHNIFESARPDFLVEACSIRFGHRHAGLWFQHQQRKLSGALSLAQHAPNHEL